MPSEACAGPHPPCRVVIIDSHRAVRELLADALRRLPHAHYEVAGLGGSVGEALALCRAHHPDVLVLEMVLPDGNGIDVINQLRQGSTQIRTVFFTGNRQISLVGQAVGLDVSGYVLKSRSLQEVFETLARVCAGGRSIDPDLLADSREAKPPTPLPPLTKREREVTRLVAQGLTTKEVAAALGVSAKTVDKHRSNLMHKLNIHDVVGLTHYAIAAGLVPVE